VTQRNLSVRDGLDIATSALTDAEDRPGQRAMAEAVRAAIEEDRHLIVQAGTGTGKTLGYLVPVLMSGRKAIVATATIALQDQIASKDLPLLAEHLAPALGLDFEWAVLKGRHNYVCRQKIAEAFSDDDEQSLPLEDESAPDRLRRQIEKVERWARTAKTGDVAEYPGSMSDTLRRAVTVTSDECPGASKCPAGSTCFAERARYSASSADLVIVNTHLYGIDVAAQGGVLPEHEVVVIDEVHNLEGIISESAGVALSASRLANSASVVRRIVADSRPAERLVSLGEALQDAIRPDLDQRVSSPLVGGIRDILTDARLAGGEILESLRSVETKDEDANQRKLRAQQTIGRLIETLDLALSAGANHVPYVSGTPTSPVLEIAPLEVGSILSEGIWARRTAILTSATVPSNLPDRTGLPVDSFDSIDVGSPFDYPSNSLLYCTKDFPNPNSPEFAKHVHDELYRLITAAGGRTLALFTSFRALDTAVEALRPILPMKVISQRDSPQKNRLAEQFAVDEESCLFATAGFFQGIDIPGRTLSLVTIDKIPFPRPDDPLLSARRDLLGDAAFREIDLPRAATLLAQATGRLIRTATDRGVVTVFDPRLATAKYRNQILSALPPMRRTVSGQEVIDFLRSLDD
jgi:ATP-dependent DNA helicase DinG